MQLSHPNDYPINKIKKLDNQASTLGKVLLFWLGTAIIFAASSAVTKPIIGIWASIIAMAMSFIGSFVLTMLFARWENLKLRELGLLPNNKTITNILGGLFIGLLLAFLQPMLVLLGGHVRLALSPQISLTVVISNLLLYLFVACREEVAFRGFPLQSLNKVGGQWMALIIVTCLFITEHRIAGWSWAKAILGSGAGGILFGLAALRTKGIALSIGLHTGWNVGQWLFGFKNETGLYKVVIEKGYETRTIQFGWISYLLVMALGILFIYYRKKTTTNDRHQKHKLSV